MALKVCFIDVTHWPAPHYYRALQNLVGVAALTARNLHTGHLRQITVMGAGAATYVQYRLSILQLKSAMRFRTCGL